MPPASGGWQEIVLILSIGVLMSVLKLRGFEIHKELLNSAAQFELMDAVREIAKSAPVFSPMTPYGKPMSVKMTSAGTYGWYSDAKGYEYRKFHPKGMAWPAIPPQILNIWQMVSGVHRSPYTRGSGTACFAAPEIYIFT